MIQKDMVFWVIKNRASYERPLGATYIAETFFQDEPPTYSAEQLRREVQQILLSLEKEGLVKRKNANSFYPSNGGAL
jgi:hypothetical protein